MHGLPILTNIHTHTIRVSPHIQRDDQYSNGHSQFFNKVNFSKISTLCQCTQPVEKDKSLFKFHYLNNLIHYYRLFNTK